ncbi:MAG: hypothetical protein ABEK01_04915 [Candidatus Nanohaloarchaea archaeon]
MRKSKLLLFSLLAVSMLAPVASQPASLGDSQGVTGMLDSLSTADIQNMRDVIIFIIIPYIGSYGVLIFLTRKAFLMAENNLGQSSGFGSSDLSSMGEKASTLISASAAALMVIGYGMVSVEVVFLIGAVGVLFLIWQFSGAAWKSSWKPDVDASRIPPKGNAERDSEAVEEQLERLGDLQEGVEDLENKVKGLEEDAQQEVRSGEKPTARKESEEAAEAVGNLAELINSEEDLIENILNLEEDKLNQLIEEASTIVEYKQRELEIIGSIRKAKRESRKVKNIVDQPGMQRGWEAHRKEFREFLEGGNFKSATDAWNSWNTSGKQSEAVHSALEHIDVQKLGNLESALNQSEIVAHADRINKRTEKLREIEEEGKRLVTEEKERVHRELKQQRKVVEEINRFKQELQKDIEEENVLEKLSERLEHDDELREKVKRDQESLGKIRSRIDSLRGHESNLKELDKRLEKIDGRELDLTRNLEMDSLREAYEFATAELTYWIFLRDLVHEEGDLGGKETEQRIVNVIMALWNLRRTIMLMDEYEKEEEEMEIDVRDILGELEKLTGKMLELLKR